MFDLDGTLIDGYAAIDDALAYAMERLGAAPPSPGAVRRMVGRGLESLLEQAVGAARAAEGVRLFRERYPQIAVEKSRLLPDVPQVIATLEARGHPMAVASNKPAPFSRLILDSLGLLPRFRAVGGPDGETPAKPDPTMLHRLMLLVGSAASDTVVVGDMEIDAEFARAAGCRIVLIPGGSRSREELVDVEADGLLEAIGDLPDWLDQNST